jgi:hypothetical protein
LDLEQSEKISWVDESQTGPWQWNKIWIDTGKKGGDSRRGDSRDTGMKMPTEAGMLGKVRLDCLGTWKCGNQFRKQLYPRVSAARTLFWEKLSVS